MNLSTRLQHAWNAFNGNDIAAPARPWDLGTASGARPDRVTYRWSTERTMVAAIYTRIAIDCAAVPIRHIRVDEDGRYVDTILSSLNRCLNFEANIDQSGRELIQDIVASLCDEGVVAVVPVDTTENPSKTGSYSINSLRVGKIMQWFPQHVQVRLYDDRDGIKKDIYVPKSFVAIIENPLYPVMNEPNSTLKRLQRKLALIDNVDEQIGANKMDLIVQLPYVIKGEMREQQAERRRKAIEMQLSQSKYGVAYTDGTERITQLNRPVENTLYTQATDLRNKAYGELGMSENIMNGTANEQEQLTYRNRTIEPILSAIVNAMSRKFLTRTAQTQGQRIMFFQDSFRLVPVNILAELADKLTRNEILTSNEFRTIIGYKPINDPKADQLRNSNISQSGDDQQVPTEGGAADEADSETVSRVRQFISENS